MIVNRLCVKTLFHYFNIDCFHCFLLNHTSHKDLDFILFFCNNYSTKECLPYLKKSKNPHVLNISPPLNMKPHWFGPHVAYTMAKYGMSMCVLGMAEEFKDDGIAVNALWPRTAVYTSAFEMLAGDDSFKFSRKVDIMADAAYEILTQDSRLYSGQFLIDEDVVRKAGVTDIVQYACVPENAGNLAADVFIDDVQFKRHVRSKL